MSSTRSFSFSAAIIDLACEGRIERDDGVAVVILGSDFHQLLRDLAAGPPVPKWHQAVLGEWFARVHVGLRMAG